MDRAAEKAGAVADDVLAHQAGSAFGRLPGSFPGAIMPPCSCKECRMSLLLLALLAAPVAPPAEPDAVSRFQCASPRPGAKDGLREIDAAYTARTIAILSAALSHNQDELLDKVSANATFEVTRGDTVKGPRGKGPIAVVEFAAALAPMGYEIRIPVAGPLSTDPCGPVSVNVLLIDKNDEEAQQLVFRFQRGFLTRIDGDTVLLDRGIFTRAPR
jgi:hypothetical protein